MQKKSDINWIGDKFPLLHQEFKWICERFPSAYYLYIVRNPFSIIESSEVRKKNENDSYDYDYKTILSIWNESLQLVCSLSPMQMTKIKIIVYEDFFNSVPSINEVIASITGHSLPLDVVTRFVDKYHSLKEKQVPRQEDLRYYVSKYADWKSYNRVCELSNSSAEQWHGK